ncbi:MAG: TlpA family protein disulfide reductase [Gemmatimonadales bacterium]|nr:MAG: TlpA family protein disulfide reductase [Gemmatimonadales bacterium]
MEPGGASRRSERAVPLPFSRFLPPNPSAMHSADPPPPSDPSPSRGSSRDRLVAGLRKIEPLLWLGLVAFVLWRFGPQLAAWTGAPVPTGEDRVVSAQLELPLLGSDEVLRPGADDGTVHVLWFWASWCRVCAFEAPGVERLHETWAQRPGEVRVTALSIDAGGPGVARAHAAEEGWSLPLGMADARTRGAMGGISAVPTTVVVDGEGRIRHVMVGVTGPGTVRRAVERLVR